MPTGARCRCGRPMEKSVGRRVFLTHLYFFSRDRPREIHNCVIILIRLSTDYNTCMVQLFDRDVTYTPGRSSFNYVLFRIQVKVNVSDAYRLHKLDVSLVLYVSLNITIIITFYTRCPILQKKYLNIVGCNLFSLLPNVRLARIANMLTLVS